MGGGAFSVAGSCTIKAIAVKDDHFDSAVATAATVRAPWTAGECLDNTNLVFETDGESPWTRDLAHPTLGVSMRSGAAADRGASELRATVEGAGTLAFAWAASTEYAEDPFEAYDGLNLYVDGVRVTDAMRGGEVAQSSWTQVVEGAGPHVICWRYEKDKSVAMGEDCVWIANVSWTPAAPATPTVVGDDGASVTGDAETGFVVKPSAGTAEVAVTIPDGVDAAKVRVEVSPDMKTVTPNGAAVRVVRDGADVTDFLDIPAAAGGVIDLGAATVKPEIANEPLDPAKNAKVDLSAPDSPSLTTAPTRKGLVYRLKEGATLEAMEANATGDSTIGDGRPWTPKVTVKGGASGFYSIHVSK